MKGEKEGEIEHEVDSVLDLDITKIRDHQRKP